MSSPLKTEDEYKVSCALLIFLPVCNFINDATNKVLRTSTDRGEVRSAGSC